MPTRTPVSSPVSARLLGLAGLLLFSAAHAAGSREESAAAKPVLDHQIQPQRRAELEAEVQTLLALSETEQRALVPEQTPFITADCPACGEGHFGRGLDRTLWKFLPPAQIVCLHCATAFPNERYPEDDHATFLNPRGEKVDIRFHRDAGGHRFALEGARQSVRNGWLLQQLESLGKLYQLTGDERMARPVVLLLDRYAQVFPHYLVKDFKTDLIQTPGSDQKRQKARYIYVSTGGPWMRNGRRYAEKPAEPAASRERTNTPYGWTESRWGWGRWGGEMPMELLRAYDLVYGSAEFARLSSERGCDVRRNIEDGLFGEAAAFLFEFPFYYHIHNNASAHIAHIVHAGRVLRRPEWVHFGFRWSREVLENYAFCRDGGFAESPGYLFVFLSSHEGNFTALEGYSDPPGYQSADGIRLDAVGSGAARAFLAKARAAAENVRFPNGSLLPISDSRHDHFVDPFAWPRTDRTALDRSRSVMLPGYGHVLLGDGDGDRQVQAHLHFSSFAGVGHTHRDGLSLMLWAFGSEFFTDIGYHRTKYRGYASTTLSHNTVVIDRTPQAGTAPKGSVLLYEPNLSGLSAVQVEDNAAYEGVASRYRRTLLLNTRDPEAPYLVDIFEVRGGRTHDYALHGPTLFDSVAETSLDLAPMTGERPLLSPGEDWPGDTGAAPYGAFTHVHQARTAEGFSTTFRLLRPYEMPLYHPNPRYPPAKPSVHFAVDEAAYRDRLELGVKCFFPGGRGERQILLGQTPSLTRSGLNGSDLTEKLQRPSLLLRREGPAGLSSVFVAVHAPYYGQSRIKHVRQLSTDDAEGGIALEIATDNRVDTVLVSLDGTDRVRTDGATLQGKVGLISRSSGVRPAAILIAGTKLGAPGVSLSAPLALHEGPIEAVTSTWDGAASDAVVTTARLPAGEALRGAWLIASLGNGAATEAYQIQRVEERGDRTWILLTDESGVRIHTDGTTQETFFPRRRFQGENRFAIHRHAMLP